MCLKAHIVAADVCQQILNRPAHQAVGRYGTGGMMDGTFEQIAQAQRFARQQQDVDDLNNEMAGRETGRLKRFLVSNATASPQQKADEERTRAMRSLMWLLEHDAEYAKLYHETKDLLIHAEAITEQALAQAQDDLDDAHTAMDALLENAARLPGGTMVFRDTDGRVVTADGTQVTNQVAIDGIVWHSNTQDYDNYVRQKQDIEAIERTIFELREYQVDVLGHARERLSDETNPSLHEELEDIQRDIQTKAPDMVKPTLSDDNVVHNIPADNPLHIAVPKLPS